MTQAVEQALVRSGLYRLLSLALMYPNADQFQRLTEGLREAQRLLSTLSDEDRCNGLKMALANLEAVVSSQTVETLQDEYVRVFTHLISRECPPYETEYGNRQAFHQAQRLADIAGVYRAFGLEVAETAKERLDHIAVELEFMGFLAFKEAYALEQEEMDHVNVVRSAQRQFLTDHLGRFALLFARLLRKKAKTGYYAAVADLLERFLAGENQLLQVQPITFRETDLTQGMNSEP